MAAIGEPASSITRPQRWDEPFGPEMTPDDVGRLLLRPEFSSIASERFPRHLPLHEILLNDTRIVRFKAGDIVVREGDYGNSAFLILAGKLRVVLAPGLPSDMLGRQPARRKGWWQSLSQLWSNRRIPEVRTARRDLDHGLRKEEDPASSHVFLQDVPAVLDKHKTAVLEEGSLFGELAALGRIPRTATMFAESECELLEIRWQGLREIRRFDEGWRRRIDERYRSNALKVHLRATPLFSRLGEDALQQLTNHTLFETYGTFDWHVSFKRLVRESRSSGEEEPTIARQGDYPDGLLMVRAGFARVTASLGSKERTLTYLGAGDSHGLDELYESWRTGKRVSMETSLFAVGYVDVLRVPTNILEEFVFHAIQPPQRRVSAIASRPLAGDGLIDWVVDERFINGSKAMLIDLERCTRCDDCVRACASTHDGNPRFVRHGKRFDHWMVANACMHCADPVCMIGCPTGAIHRDEQGGVVVINDDTCIGCSTCANSCPYDNIQMAAINDEHGRPLIDPGDQKPIVKATKCDLCAEQLGGPACERACPHDALHRVDFREWIRGA
jgi:Fe-S-cluster-containing dehydrogenase component/CRP-like cAMP-binding protein